MQELGLNTQLSYIICCIQCTMSSNVQIAAHVLLDHVSLTRLQSALIGRYFASS